MNAISIAVLYAVVNTRGFIRSHTSSDRGASAVEYGLLVGLIAVVIAGAVLALGGGLNTLFSNTSSCIGGAAAGTASSTTCQ